jgi:nicotinamidase-related amidase
MAKAPARAHPTQVTVPVAGTALLLIDVINDLDFPGSHGLIQQAEAMAGRLAALKRRASAASVPIIYINDNFGQWRSDFRQTVAHCTSRTSPGRKVSTRLRPTARDYFVLKPKHSAFYQTCLGLLSEQLGAKTLFLAGFATDSCVCVTASDAYVRDYALVVPRDANAALTQEFGVATGGTASRGPSSRSAMSSCLRPCSAGPLSTSPVGLKREPWQGQSQLCSALFQRTTPPRCGQTAEHTLKDPSDPR